jgi:hypothetical protein
MRRERSSLGAAVVTPESGGVPCSGRRLRQAAPMRRERSSLGAAVVTPESGGVPCSGRRLRQAAPNSMPVQVIEANEMSWK